MIDVKKIIAAGADPDMFYVRDDRVVVYEQMHLNSYNNYRNKITRLYNMVRRI